MNTYAIPGIRSQGGYRVGQFKQEAFFIDPEHIIKKVNDYFRTDIFFPSKDNDVCLPRQIAVYLIWENSMGVTGDRMSEIMNGRIKRVTCLHANKIIKSKVSKVESKTKRIVDEIIRSL